MITTIILALTNFWRRLHNILRRLRRQRIDYVRIELSGALPEFSAMLPWWQRRFLSKLAPESLMGLRRKFQRIAADPQVRGVLLVLRDLTAGWATAESLRAEIHALRAAGKHVVVYAPGASTRDYFIACAADAILMPPSAYLNLLGIRIEARFLADALRMAGIEAEVVAVSPYKSGPDPLTRSEMSPEAREQLERILNQRYAALLAAIAADRRLSEPAISALIDRAPFSAADAHAAGLIDGACYEDELEAWLQKFAGIQPQKVARKEQPEPIIHEWDKAARRLRRPTVQRQQHYVAVISIEGAIMTGRSRDLPFPLPILGGGQAGSDSIIQALRKVERDKRIAALVLHIDSPGGDAFASDLIWREVMRVQRAKPVVVSMANVAASGGYYVAAGANTIIAQPATLTGSIGVYALRPVANDLLTRLGINTVVLARGARSGLTSTTLPLTADEREATRQIVFANYTEFRQRVASGRNLSEEQLEPIAGGRVWTGSEALQNGLVDQLGGLTAAIARARELAELPPDPQAPILRIDEGRSGWLPPLPFPAAVQRDIFALLKGFHQPRVLAVLPWLIDE